MADEPEWVNVHVGHEGDDFAIDGIPVWQHEWHRTGEEVMLEHRPDDSRLRMFPIYEIRTDGRVIRFAAANVVLDAFSFHRFIVKPDKFKSLKKSMDIRDYLTKKGKLA